MKHDSRNIWYVLDISVFLIIVFVNVYLWNRMGTPKDWLESLTPLKVFIFGLAAYRLPDIITQESVTDILRAPFQDKTVENDTEKWIIPRGGFRGFLGTLLSCPSCMGVWTSMFLFYFYAFYPT